MRSTESRPLPSLTSGYGLGLSEFSVYFSLQPDESLNNAAATLYSFCTELGPPLESTVLNASSLQRLAASGARDPSHKQRVQDLAKTRRKPLAIAAALRSGIRSTVSSALDALVIAVEGSAPGNTEEALNLAVASKATFHRA